MEHITERPLPRDVILQVEAFVNSTHLWDRRERAVADLYHSIHKHEFEFSTAVKEQPRTGHIDQSLQTKDTERRLGLGSDICEYLTLFGFKICCNSRNGAILEGNELNSESVHVSTSDSGSLVTKRHQTGTGNNGSARERDQFHRVYAQGLDFNEDAGMHTRAYFTEDMRSLADNHSLFELLDFYSKLRLYSSSVSK